MKTLINYFLERQKLSLVLAIIWTIIILVGCTMPGRDLPPITVFAHFDKVVHFIFFLVFFVLWFCASYLFRYKALFITLIACLLGFSIEFYQLHFVTGRSFDVWDGMADTIGAMGGWLILNWNNKLRHVNV
jgi:VanZ family protein